MKEPHPRVTAIAFDCGGVLFSNAWNDEGEDASFNVIHQRLGIAKRRGDEIFLRHWPKIRVGSEREDVFFLDLISVAKNRMRLSELKALYRSCIIKKDAFEIVEKLRTSHPDVLLFTLNDEGKEWMDARIEKFGLRKYFSGFITSGYVGCAKTDGKQIYKIFLERTRVHATECIFIDNKRKLLIPARALGFNTVLFKNARLLEEELKRQGIDLSKKEGNRT